MRVSFTPVPFPGCHTGRPLRFCLIKGAYSLPCVRGGGSAKGGVERVARRQSGFRVCPSIRLRCLSGTAIPQSRCRSTAPFAQGSLCAHHSLPCVRGGGSAVGGDERVARRQSGFRGCPSIRLRCLSGTAIPQSALRAASSLYSREPFTSVTADSSFFTGEPFASVAADSSFFTGEPLGAGPQSFRVFPYFSLFRSCKGACFMLSLLIGQLLYYYSRCSHGRYSLPHTAQLR